MRAGSAPALCPGKAGREWCAHAQKAAAGAGGRAAWVWEAGVSRQVERSGVAGAPSVRPGPARVGGRPAGRPVSGAWAGGEEGSEVKGQSCVPAGKGGVRAPGSRPAGVRADPWAEPRPQPHGRVAKGALSPGFAERGRAVGAGGRHALPSAGARLCRGVPAGRGCL